VLRSLRTTVLAAIILPALLAAGLTTMLGIRLSRDAYLNLALRDIDYMTEQMVETLSPLARGAALQSFAMIAPETVDKLGEQYFQKNGMSGYAVVLSRDGSIIYAKGYPPNATLKDVGEQGVSLLNQMTERDFTGQIFYKWQDPGETKPRDKFASIRPIPDRPDWVVMVTAYTTDDLLVPFRGIQQKLLLVGLGTLVVGVILAFVFSGRLLQAIRPVEEGLKRLAAGDMRELPGQTDQIKSRRDELGAMARAYLQMQESLRTLVQQIHQTAQEVTSASQELAQSSEHAARGAQESSRAVGEVAQGAAIQAENVSEIRQTTGQLRETIEQIARGSEQTAGEVTQAASLLNQVASSLSQMTENATAVSEHVDQAANTARRGAQVVSRTMGGMERIRETVGLSAAKIRELEEVSAQIGAITQVISEIAEQTNMLALNAAIEAARAGEHGRGFAVVAEEVRRLAERSATSTKEIASLVGSIQSRTLEAVHAMDAGTTEVESGAQLASEAGQALEEILSMVERAAHDVQAVAQSTQAVQARTADVVRAFDTLAAVAEENTAATEEMSAGAMQVNHSVDQMADVAQRNASAAQEVSAAVEEMTAAADQVASAAQHLSATADRLRQQVSHFQI